MQRKTTLMRIGILGPESAGKTTMARALSVWYGCPWVAECARSYLRDRKTPVVEAELEHIARLQAAAETTAATKAQHRGHRLLICDTTQLVIRIWSLEVYGRCAPWIEAAWAAEVYGVVLLCAPDIPWEPDPLRSAPDHHTRARLFARYEEALQTANRPYHILGGSHLRRLSTATTIIERAFAKSAGV